MVSQALRISRESVLEGITSLQLLFSGTKSHLCKSFVLLSSPAFLSLSISLQFIIIDAYILARTVGCANFSTIFFASFLAL